VLPAPLRMSLIRKALGYQPGAFVLSVVVVDNLPQSFQQCKSLKGLYFSDTGISSKLHTIH
jgi:hypothetical protein